MATLKLFINEKLTLDGIHRNNNQTTKAKGNTT